MRVLVCGNMCLSITVRVLHKAMPWSKCGGGVVKLEKNPKKREDV